MRKALVSVLAGVVVQALALFAGAAPAGAEGPAPGWRVFSYDTPTKMTPGQLAGIRIRLYNVGGATGTATLTDKLPPQLTATNIEAEIANGGSGETGTTCSGTTVVTCAVGETTPNSTVEIKIAAQVAADAVVGSEAENLITVVGPGAASPAREAHEVVFGESPGVRGTKSEFGFEHTQVWFSNANGTTDTQAGSHPYAFTVVWAANSKPDQGLAEGRVLGYANPLGGEMDGFNLNLPPGMVGDPTAVPQCTREQLDEQGKIEGGFEVEGRGGCPADSQIGVEEVDVQGVINKNLAVFNMVPPAGLPAQFAFVYEDQPVFINSGVRTGGPTAEASDDGITSHIIDIPERAVLFSSTTIWGIPAEMNGSGLPPVALMTLPSKCAAPVHFVFEHAETWGQPGVYGPAFVSPLENSEGVPVPITGCDRLQFAPTLSMKPDTTYSDSPAGLNVEVKSPQEGLLAGNGLSAATLKDTTVTLPEGMVINPGQAAGLQACQTYEDGRETEGPPTCPAASKVGEDEIATPLLRNRLKGGVYIMQNSPPEMKILVAASGEGVNLKLLGTIHLNEATGRITTTFEETPSLPFTVFKLTFSGGPQAALATPPRCGVYGSSEEFVSWSTPLVESFRGVAGFEVTQGPNGSGCVDQGQALPFSPDMIAGSTTDQAGGYTNFSVLFQRPDGQQRVSRLKFKTPEGLLGMISNVTLCQEPGASKGECPAASQIGHTVVGAGPGAYPLFIPEPGNSPAPIYITGPYEGAPYGLAIVVPIIAGPFNLGTEVVRGRIEVDRRTAQLTVTTDPLPVIVKGIPADMRSINAVIERPGFMFNPTSCAPMAFSGEVESTEGATTSVSSPLQVGSCRALTFKPNFQVSAPAKYSRADGASLYAKIIYPTGKLGHNQASSQSNIEAVKVELPKQMPSRLSTLQKACPGKVFEADPAQCPAPSVVGHVRAVTPVLPVPLTGPAYFVSHGNEAFPSLIMVLQGEGITVEVVGSTYISKQGITSSTFHGIPDVPITLFELVLPEGPDSALTGVGNFCKETLKMPTDFTAQDGATRDQFTKVSITGCPKAKAKKKKVRKGKHAKKGSRAKKRGRHR